VNARARWATVEGCRRTYCAAIPYGCMEQKIIGGSGVARPGALGTWAAQIPAAYGLRRSGEVLPFHPYGDPVLTAYLVAVSHASGWTLSNDLLKRVSQGLRRFVEGSLVRYSPLPTADLTVRKLAAIAALCRLGAAEPALVQFHCHRTEPLADIGRDRLGGDPARFRANPQPQGAAGRGEQVLRARLTYQGTLISFSTEARTAWWC